MIRLLKYLKGSAVLCAILAPIMMFIEVVMDLNQPKLMSNIIDIGIANGDAHYVLTVGIKMIIIAVIGAFGGMACGYLASIASMTLGKNVRKDLFTKIQSLSFREIDEFKTSSLITRLTNDVTQVQQMILTGLKIMVRAPLLCIGGIIMAFSLSPKLSLVFLIAIPLVLISIIYITSRSIPAFTNMQNKIDRVNLVMRENLLGIRVIKAFVMEKKAKERFDISNDELMDASIKAQSITVILWPLVTLAMNLSVIAVLWFGGNMVNKGSLEIGKIMAFINYLIQIMSSLNMMLMIIISISRAKVSAARINEVLDTETSIVEAKNPKAIKKYDIELRDVCFKYNKESENVLNNISFKIAEGEKVGIIGATGSGKSSLIALIPRLYDATSGKVLIGGTDVRDVSEKELRSLIGIVLQESILFSGTIEDNLKFGNNQATKDMMDNAAMDAEAYEFICSNEEGYERNVEQRGKNLSGGQKQRLSIARTLLRNPKILILDDSTSALDMATEAKLQKSLKRRLEGSTTIIIAQRISAVMDCDKIIVLDDGEVSAIGKHGDLLKDCEIYRSIAISQLGEEEALNGI